MDEIDIDICSDYDSDYRVDGLWNVACGSRIKGGIKWRNKRYIL